MSFPEQAVKLKELIKRVESSAPFFVSIGIIVELKTHYGAENGIMKEVRIGKSNQRQLGKETNTLVRFADYQSEKARNWTLTTSFLIEKCSAMT